MKSAESKGWSDFTADNPNVFQIDAENQTENFLLINKMLEKHEFWYETLPNKLFDDCLKESHKTSTTTKTTKSKSDTFNNNNNKKDTHSSYATLSPVFNNSSNKRHHKNLVFYFILNSVLVAVYLQNLLA